ncbi:MAG: hypothetical protein PHV11_10385 [Candidatus Bipolaricaulis sp.]|nr:hypothetical protein [Candidatus Bipolaricaulis sp.]
MKISISAKEVVKVRQSLDCSLQEANSIVIKEKLLEKVREAESLEDIRDVIVFILNNSNITFTRCKQ